jgi:hypothetical protein
VKLKLIRLKRGTRMAEELGVFDTEEAVLQHVESLDDKKDLEIHDVDDRGMLLSIVHTAQEIETLYS